MNTPQFWPERWETGLLPVLAIATALITTGATPPSPAPLSPRLSQVADLSIQVPVVLPGRSVIVVPSDSIIVVPRRRRRESVREVTIQFVARGNDWATVYLNDRLLFRASNTRRSYSITLEPGAYYLEITGVSRFDVWGSGYLDVGRNNSNIVVIQYGKNEGVQVSGDPYAWIPD